MLRSLVLSLLALLGSAAVAGGADTAPRTAGAGKVQLELVGEAQQGAVMAFQDWLQVLRGAGIQNVRLRAAADGDKLGIDSPRHRAEPALRGHGSAQRPRRDRDSRRRPLPPRRAKRLAAWLDDLAERGPPDRREPLAALRPDRPSSSMRSTTTWPG